MNDIQLSKFLGWFSLGLGALELLASRRITTMLGVANPRLVQAFGAREIAAGLMVLNKPDTAMPDGAAWPAMPWMRPYWRQA